MKVGLEVTYRDVERSDAIDTLIQEKLAKLERLCSYINSCHIAIEKVHDRPSHGSPYRVRIDLTLPPNHELVADSNPGDTNQHVALDTVIRDAFSKMERQLKAQTRQQREAEKAQINTDPQDTTALVTKIFREQGYGFIKALDGEDIYFHRNSVIHDDFDRLEVGTGVRYVATMGEQGPQATTVQIVDKAGVRAGKADATLVDPPLGWE
ncbi:MAG: HPF/RaiA family ribosome-associated protein [Leptolyngbyaceae cyanobacterium bins.349]|nr:HPF/RaiA family ribosome-associated protein [Leptolyngbyaceae cyanobacterium bins.349]